jgi:hypothetical protein
VTVAGAKFRAQVHLAVADANDLGGVLLGVTASRGAPRQPYGSPAGKPPDVL